MDTSSQARLRSLKGFWSLPGIALLLWGCEILGYIHLGSFAVEIGTHTMEWARAYPVIVLIAGFAWLGILIFWPDIRPHLAKLPKPIHERVSDHQERLTQVESMLGSKVATTEMFDSYRDEIFQRVLVVEQGYSRNLSDVEAKLLKVLKNVSIEAATFQTATTEHLQLIKSELWSRVDGAEKGLSGTTDNIRVAFDRLNQQDNILASTGRVIDAVNERFTGAHQRTTDLVNRVSSLIDARNKLFKELVGYSVFMLEITRLIDQADYINERLLQFNDSFPDSEVSRTPFSSPWWRRDLPFVAPPAVVEWSLFVNRHMRHCDNFSATFGQSLLNSSLRELTRWTATDSLADSLSVVSGHRATLFALRQSYAITFCEESAKVIIT